MTISSVNRAFLINLGYGGLPTGSELIDLAIEASNTAINVDQAANASPPGNVLNYGWNQVNQISSGYLQLPTANQGQLVQVFAFGSTTLIISAQTGDLINGGTDSFTYIAAASGNTAQAPIIFMCAVDGQWVSNGVAT